MEKELIKALLKVQQELPVISKDTKAYNYKYAPLEVIWEKVQPILSKNGFVVTHEVGIGGVKTIASHEHGEKSSFFEFSTDLKPQDQGSAITYGKRYNLVALFNIQLENEDDDGKTAQDAKKGTSKTFSPQSDTEAPLCPLCDKPMVISKAGNPYCNGKYKGTCPKGEPQELNTTDKRIMDELDSSIPVIQQED